MNINLLPQKFYINQATSLIVLVAGGSLMLLAALLAGMIFLSNRQLTQLSFANQQIQMEETILRNQVMELELEQSADIQSYLIDYKEENVLVHPIITSFKETANLLDLTINSYQVMIADQQDLSMVSQTGELLYTPISMVVQGDLFDNMPRFKTELEKMAMVYDVHPVKNVVNTDGVESEFLIRLRKLEYEMSDES